MTKHVFTLKDKNIKQQNNKNKCWCQDLKVLFCGEPEEVWRMEGCDLDGEFLDVFQFSRLVWGEGIKAGIKDLVVEKK